jgi:molybdopterin-containing oxidoreductase family iron-sulfur binding subunit
MSAHCHSSTPPAFPPRKGNEFLPGASHWPADLSRREFLQLMGASLALAGLAGCGRPSSEKIVPYVRPPEMTPSPDAAWYATAMPWQGYARGVLAKSIHGRPIKLEGNPDHPESLGATDAITQAAILSLYDPDRSPAPLRDAQVSSWEIFERDWRVRHSDLAARKGAGFALLTEPTTSPTLLREIHALLDAWPEARWFQHTALPRYDRDGAQDDFDFAAPDIILSLGADSFYQHPAALRHIRAFASRRRSENNALRLNHVFALEPTLSLTGNQADLRLGLTPARIGVVLNALSRALEGDDLDSATAALSEIERRLVRECSALLRENSRSALCVVGPELPGEFHAWADVFNARFAQGAATKTPALRSDGDQRASGGLGALIEEIEAGRVSNLCILGANPAYTAPAGLDVAGALRRVAFPVHLGEYVDETARECAWHLPEAHFLETWSDLRAYSGTATVLQPLVEPRHAGRSAAEFIHTLRTGESRSAYDLVRETWRAGNDSDFETRWHGWLDRGVIDAVSAPRTRTPSPTATATASFPRFPGEMAPRGVTVLFRASANLHDGRWANNAWLQELPQPFTALVWENAALIDAGLAARLSLKNGDVISLETSDARLEAPVWILPGQAPETITLPLGYGRTHGGGVANARGFSAYVLLGGSNPWQRDDLRVRRIGKSATLVCTQGHFTMEGRDLARSLTASEFAKAKREEDPAVTLFPAWPREGYAWGMSIDLGTCFGCNACVIACQAENNIPVVGREQVARGREMHWIRIDRYFDGNPAAPRVLHQPIPCMHCENAPCEVVCPVGATVHTSEGVNDMVYNRCIGTRYCSNNCPYKVRRFNFLDYRAPEGSPVYLQSNPDVTVRERGVMEKCTYCTQRINAARITAEKENRRIRDGELRTACQQVCPTEAIVFGDLNDPSSHVTQRKQERSSYRLLGELNTRPRTTYLAKIVPDSAGESPRAQESFA